MKNNKFKKGFTLLLSLLVTSVILSVGLGVFNIMTKELKLSGLGRESQIAFYAADAGIECFFYWDVKHPSLAKSAFEQSEDISINCNNKSIDIIDTDSSENGLYNFTLPFGALSDTCVKVKVEKIGLITIVESRGYNMNDCDSPSPFKVERAIRMVLNKEE